METIIQTLITIFNRTIEQIRKYGKSLILWAVVLFLFIGMFIYFFKLNSILIEQFFNKQQIQQEQEQVEQQEQHNTQVHQRIELNAKVYNILNRFFYNNEEVINIALMEHHNGSTTLSNKAFLYISNTFELCKSNDTHFDNIQRLPISLFNIFNVLYNHNFNYNCTLQQLKNDDAKLYSIISNIKNAKHVYAIELSNEYNISVVTVIVTTSTEFNNELKDKLFQLSNNLSILLT